MLTFQHWLYPPEINPRCCAAFSAEDPDRSRQGMSFFPFSGFSRVVRTPVVFKACLQWIDLFHEFYEHRLEWHCFRSWDIFFSCSWQSVGVDSTKLCCNSPSLPAEPAAKGWLLCGPAGWRWCDEMHGQIYIEFRGSNNGPLSSCGCSPLCSQALSAQEMPALTDR